MGLCVSDGCQKASVIPRVICQETLKIFGDKPETVIQDVRDFVIVCQKAQRRANDKFSFT